MVPAFPEFKWLVRLGITPSVTTFLIRDDTTMPSMRPSQYAMQQRSDPEPLGIWAVYPTPRLVPLKVRVFFEALEQSLS